MSGLTCVMVQSKEGIKTPNHVFIQQRGGQGPAASPSGATAPLRTTVFLSSFFPNPHLYLNHFADEETRHRGRKDWPKDTWPESCGARVLAGLLIPGRILSSPRRAVCTLGLGCGRVSGLGCVGSRAQKAQCLPLPPSPGPTLLQEPGGCPAPDWAKRAACDICAHLRAQPQCWTHLPHHPTG